MSIKAGTIIHSANGTVIDRLQTAGPTGLNIPSAKVLELGNFQTVAVVRDIPDVTFDLDSLDVSTEIEATLLGLDPTATNPHDAFDFGLSMPMDVISPWKAGNGNYNVSKGVIVPYLSLDTVTYKFGVGQDSSETFNLRTDSIFYIPGNPYYEVFTITSGVNQVYALGHAAMPYTDAGHTLHVLSVCAKNTSTGLFKRLFFGDDYTDTTTTFTTLANLAALGYTKLHITYGSTVATTYNQAVHQGVSVKPAAVRGKDIDVYVSSGGATPILARWKGVQAATATRKVNLQNDQEFGNHKYVSVDYDTADVSGTIDVKSVDSDDFFAKVAQVANVSVNEVAGVLSSTPLAMEVRISHPDTGAVLKTLYVPDARIEPPPLSNKVNTKLTAQFKWGSDTGSLVVYNGTRS